MMALKIVTAVTDVVAGTQVFEEETPKSHSSNDSKEVHEHKGHGD